MEIKSIIEKLLTKEFPIGIGGCRNHDFRYDCCEYDITVFDEKNQNDSILESDGFFFHIHHASLKETRPDILILYDNMMILFDEQWELQTLLSKIKEKKEQLFNAYVNNCLVESQVCITKATSGLGTDPYAGCWLNSSSYFIADAICGIGLQQPAPTHMLKQLRELKKNKINEFISILTESIGIERATPSLLSRMLKSTIGFSDMIEKNQHSMLITKKYDYMINHSLLSDCYFYLGYVNRNNFFKIQDIHKKPEFIHILKTAFDLEFDVNKFESQADKLHETIDSIIRLVHKSN